MNFKSLNWKKEYYVQVKGVYWQKYLRILKCLIFEQRDNRADRGPK